MSKVKNATITVQGTEITIIREHTFDYISLTDMVRGLGEDNIIYNWLRNRNTIEFLGIWEQLNNPDFNPLEFERFKKEAGAEPVQFIAEEVDRSHWRNRACF